MPRGSSNNDDGLFDNNAIVPAETPAQIEVARPEEMGLSYEANIDLDPIVYGPEMQAFGLGLPILKATELVGKRVVVIGWKQFESAFPGQKYAVFCQCYFPDTRERFTTVFGGNAIIEMLVVNYFQGHQRPVSFIVDKKVSGKGREYYVPGI